MASVGVKFEDDILAHMALHELSPAYKSIRDLLSHTAESSNSSLTLATVLDHLQQTVLDVQPSTTSTALSTERRVTYERCLNGSHNPKTAHSEANCYQVHPEKRPSRQSNHSNLTTARAAANTTVTGTVLATHVMNASLTGKPVLDSGASQSMFISRSSFASYQPCHATISVANGQTIEAIGVGSIQGECLGNSVTLTNVLHVPELQTNLVSLVDLVRKGFQLSFMENGSFSVLAAGNRVLNGATHSGVMELDFTAGTSPPHLAMKISRIDGRTLHRRLGHPGRAPFEKAYPSHDFPEFCEPCILSKHHRLPFKGKLPTPTC